MKEQSYNVLKYLQEHKLQSLTANDVAEALGMSKRMIDSIFSSAIVRQKLGERKEISGKVYLVLTPAGLQYKQ